MITYAEAIERLAERTKDNKEYIAQDTTQRRNQTVDLYGMQITREVGSTSSSSQTTVPEQRNKFVKSLLELVNDSNACYSTSNRWSPCYDNTSSIITALKQAGYDTANATSINDIKVKLMQAGWEEHPVIDVTYLIAGDIVIADGSRAEVYVGNGNLASFRSAGDIGVKPYYDYPWSCVLRNRLVNEYSEDYGLYNPDSVEGKIAQFFADDFSKEQVAGIMGNIKADSDFKPEYHNESTGASGLFAWTDTRLQGLKDYAQSKGTEWTDIQTQLEYAYAEMTPDGDRTFAQYQWIYGNWTYDMLVSSATVQTACAIFYSGFEHGGTPLLNTRTEYANTVYAMLDGIINVNGTSVGGTAKFYISISPDMVYLQTYQFKVVIENATSTDFSLTIDGYNLTDYFKLQSGEWINGNGIFPSASLDTSYDLLQVASVIVTEAENTTSAVEKERLMTMYKTLTQPGLHEVTIGSSGAYTVSMLLYPKYSHTNR